MADINLACCASVKQKHGPSFSMQRAASLCIARLACALAAHSNELTEKKIGPHTAQCTAAAHTPARSFLRQSARYQLHADALFVLPLLLHFDHPFLFDHRVALRERVIEK